MKSYSALRDELRRRGYYRKATARIVAELAFHLATLVGSFALFLACDNTLVRCAAVVAAAYASVAVSTNGHTASHYATSDRKWLNELLTYVTYPFTLMVSANYWWHKHVTLHHPAPNVVGLDGDIELMPWFAYTEEDYRRGGRLRRLYYRLQGLIVPFVIAMLAIKMQLQSQVYLARVLCDRSQRKAGHWLDLALSITHVGVWYVLPISLFGAEGVLWFAAGRLILSGYFMFAVFAPAHFPAEAVAIGPTDGPEDFVLLQTATTVNFRTGFIGRLLCAGVQYQIEHHLFCGISHVHYPAVSRLVAEFCKKHGYPYVSLGWAEGIWKSYLAFWRPKKLEPTLAQLRGVHASPRAILRSPMTRAACAKAAVGSRQRTRAQVVAKAA
jgi:fatty acid desaturase